MNVRRMPKDRVVRWKRFQLFRHQLLLFFSLVFPPSLPLVFPLFARLCVVSSVLLSGGSLSSVLCSFLCIGAAFFSLLCFLISFSLSLFLHLVRSLGRDSLFSVACSPIRAEQFLFAFCLFLPFLIFLSFFFFFFITNGITGDSEIFARTICSVRTRSRNVSALIKGTAFAAGRLTRFANTSLFFFLFLLF